MNFYEADLIKTQQRIKELEENPGRRLRSFKIFLENRIKLREEQIEAWRQGRPFIDSESLAPRFLRAMGFMPLERQAQTMPSTGAALAGQLSPFALKERARALGLPVDTACDQTYHYAAAADAGSLPPESIVYASQKGCPIKVFQKLFVVYQLRKSPKSSIFRFDRPPEEDEASLEYLVDQYREFIEFAEKKFPGVIKYDEAKLIEYQNITEAAKPYFLEIYEMMKHKPSPIAGEDITERPAWEYRDVNYARAKRDEVAERLAKGIAAVPGEKLRVMWNNDLVFFFDAFEVLAKRQVASLFWFQPENHYYDAPWPTPAYYGGRKLTPLEEEARWGLSQARAGTGAHWIDHMIRICRDLKIDAVINSLQVGASCVWGLRGILADAAEKELGIPTLQLEHKRWDPNFADEAKLTAQLDEFAQMCLSRKGLA